LHVPFKAWNGEEIKERKGEEEKAKMIDETVSSGLLNQSCFLGRQLHYAFCLGYLAIQFIGGKLLFRDHLGIVDFNTDNF